MNISVIKAAVIVLLILKTATLYAQQDRYVIIENKLKELATTSPGLNEKVELSVNAATIQDFLRGLATTNNLNVSIDEGLNARVVNNFSNVTVADVILFLCKKYDLDVSFIGNIMSFTKYIDPPIKTPPYVSKKINIVYDNSNDLLTMDLANDSLSLVAKEITKISQKNVVFAPDLASKIVNGYIQKMSFSSALDKFAFANDLKISSTNDNFYLIEKKDAISSSSGNGNNNNVTKQATNANQAIDLKINNNLITMDVANQPIANVLSAVSTELKVNYFLFTDPKGNTSLNIKDATYNEFLNLLFTSTDYTFKNENNIYLIGDRSIEGLRATKVITLKYRTIDKVIDFIPAELKKGVEVKTFMDQNSLIVSGSQPRIAELEAFIRDIDRIVPVISIEVMIVDVNNSHTVESGIKAGLGEKPATTGGSVFPELNLNLGAGSINSIISGINGLGIVNLGKVTPNFYMNLRLLEQNGDVKINSTPLLSTLNGNKATMSIGETRYYQENNTNVISTQSTTTVQSKIYKPLQAEFSMSINPTVSGDEQITLEISVKQSSFTNQSSGEGSPFNSTSRDFQSLIRVKNQEMIMLGGLDNDTRNSSSTGVPVLSRIPIIRWFFSSRSKTKAKSKLTIFIKPTVIY